MLLDADSFDLVQHVDTVLAAVEGDELEARINPELMQSVLEVTTPVCRTAADALTRRCVSCASTSRGSRASRGCAWARRARIRSASSSGSGSPRATGIARSSTSSSTWPGAS